MRNPNRERKGPGRVHGPLGCAFETLTGAFFPAGPRRKPRRVAPRFPGRLTRQTAAPSPNLRRRGDVALCARVPAAGQPPERGAAPLLQPPGAGRARRRGGRAPLVGRRGLLSGARPLSCRPRAPIHLALRCNANPPPLSPCSTDRPAYPNGRAVVAHGVPPWLAPRPGARGGLRTHRARARMGCWGLGATGQHCAAPVPAVLLLVVGLCLLTREPMPDSHD